MTGKVKLAVSLILAVVAFGCGPKEDPSVGQPADKSAATAKTGKVTNAKGQEIDPEQKAALDLENKK